MNGELNGSPTKNRKASFPVTGMTCATCAGTIADSLKGLDGVLQADVNLATERASVTFDPEKVDIWIGGVKVCEYGGGLPFDEAAALRELQQSEVTYTLDFADGTASDTMWTCDFSLDYVKINADYRT